MKYVWVHGLGQTSGSWNKTILLLGPQDAICPNLAELIRGKEATYRNLYEAFSAVCDAADESLCLCGLSEGTEKPTFLNSFLWSNNKIHQF